MNLKTRIALNLSIAFSIIMGIVMTVIYISFANFRKAEFKENLEHSAVVTANYISKLPQKVLNNDDKTVDDINNDEDDFLIKEKILVFNNEKNLIFSNVLDERLVWDNSHLNNLDKKKRFFGLMIIKKILGLKRKLEEIFFTYSLLRKM